MASNGIISQRQAGQVSSVQLYLAWLPLKLQLLKMYGNYCVMEFVFRQLRYLDDREDEQLRGITMKSSAIALQYITSEYASAHPSPSTLVC